MAAHSFACRSLQAGILLVIASAALAQEPALALDAQSPELEWGPCPSLLPKGCSLAVLHGDPGKPNADVFLKVPGKSSIAPHIHTSAERMILVAGRMRVTYAGQEPAVLRPGSYAFGPASRPHAAACLSSEPCILFIAFEGPVDIKAASMDTQ